MDSYFYRCEVKGIQGYVLRGNKLREMLGASALIKHLVGRQGVIDEVLDEACQGQYDVLAQAAGGATVRFDELADLQRFATLWPMEAQLFAPGVLVVQAWAKGSHDVLDVLARKLRHARNDVPAALPPGNPVLERASGGTQPAVEADEDVWLDAQGFQARRASRTNRLMDDLEKSMLGADLGWELPKDISEIAGRDHRHYIAVVHIDGNAVGRRVRALRDPKDYKAFSQTLEQATLEAARAATRETLAPQGEKSKAALGRPIVIGGDDLTVIVRADGALSFVERYCKVFQDICVKSKPLAKGGPMTASAGVAFVRASHPFRLAYQLAEHLCHQAKREGKVLSGGAPPAMVAFHRVSASLNPEPEQLEGVSLGPYLVTENSPRGGYFPLTAVVKATHAASDVPRGPIRELARALEVRDPRLGAKFQRFKQVLQGRNLQAALQQGLTGFGPDAFDHAVLDAPVQRNGQELDQPTPWFDVITLLSLGMGAVPSKGTR